MSTLTSPGEEILVIAEEPAPNRVGRSCWWAVGAVGAGLVVLVMSEGVVSAIRESQRTQCADHLRRLGLALLEYQEAHGRFPAPVLGGRDGTALLSWRVAILPHLGYRALYERFHRDEPWDSSHNRALLAEMPPEFACPAGPGRQAGRTGYLVVVGPKTDPWTKNTPFEPTRGAEIREFTDGLSNTILVFETDTFVPWTKPDDLHWGAGEPMPSLVSPHRGGTNVLFADGSARFLKATIPSETLLAILTINGGEVVGGG
jgi:prepilin-type processing-associated H-X9-DG protein